ncbi:hypothetical protein IPA_02665 [Ignicoccus pacificus DSM 13166]|uniref:Uncharacterized protein n=1 Tax=Ignicoccus pacificus DSM 13166 TaxID=940294 RepID=A0A977PKN9_9CREN|nr:hypothetical protein IPA_02665 [Ignicoccus pacificus DSM 13166]
MKALEIWRREFSKAIKDVDLHPSGLVGVVTEEGGGLIESTGEILFMERDNFYISTNYLPFSNTLGMGNVLDSIEKYSGQGKLVDEIVIQDLRRYPYFRDYELGVIACGDGCLLIDELGTVMPLPRRFVGRVSGKIEICDVFLLAPSGNSLNVIDIEGWLITNGLDPMVINKILYDKEITDVSSCYPFFTVTLKEEDLLTDVRLYNVEGNLKRPVKITLPRGSRVTLGPNCDMISAEPEGDKLRIRLVDVESLKVLEEYKVEWDGKLQRILWRGGKLLLIGRKRLLQLAL